MSFSTSTISNEYHHNHNHQHHHQVTVLQIDQSYRIENFFLNSVGAKKIKDIRQMYSQNILERNELKTNLFINDLEAKFICLQSQLWDKAWLLQIISICIDFILCVAYLYEVEYHVTNTENESIEVPTWLFAKRPDELWYLILIAAYLKLIIFLLLALVWYRSTQIYYFNYAKIANAFLVIIFCCYAFIPKFKYLYFPYWLFCVNIVYNIRLLCHRKSIPFKITEFSEKLWILSSSKLLP